MSVTSRLHPDHPHGSSINLTHIKLINFASQKCAHPNVNSTHLETSMASKWKVVDKYNGGLGSRQQLHFPAVESSFDCHLGRTCVSGRGRCGSAGRRQCEAVMTLCKHKVHYRHRPRWPTRYAWWPGSRGTGNMSRAHAKTADLVRLRTQWLCRGKASLQASYPHHQLMQVDTKFVESQ